MLMLPVGSIWYVCLTTSSNVRSIPEPHPVKKTAAAVTGKHRAKAFRMRRRLFITQRHHGIDVHGPACRNKTRQQGRGAEQKNYHDICRWITCAHTVKKRCH